METVTQEAPAATTPATVTQARVFNLDLVKQMGRFRSKDATRECILQFCVNEGQLFATDGHSMMTVPLSAVIDVEAGTLVNGAYQLAVNGTGRKAEGTLLQIPGALQVPNIEQLFKGLDKYEPLTVYMGGSFGTTHTAYALARRAVCIRLDLLERVPEGTWDVRHGEPSGEGDKAQVLGPALFEQEAGEDVKIRVIIMPCRL